MKIYSKLLCREMECNHIHPLCQEDIEEIFKAVFSTPRNAGTLAIEIPAKGDYIMGLVPRKMVSNKKALFWAKRGERPWPSLCIRAKYLSYTEKATKIKVVFWRGEHSAKLITAYPQAEGAYAPALEPDNYLRKKGGKWFYNEEEFADLCEFWANWVLVVEPGETYTPAPTPRWYQRYWRLKYRPS